MPEEKQDKQEKQDKRALSPEQKAAAVVVSLGVDKASQIYKHLSEEDLEKLTVEVAKLQHLTPEEIEEVLDEFYKMCLTQKVVTDGGSTWIIRESF